jgi:hypothetical protein
VRLWKLCKDLPDGEDQRFSDRRGRQLARVVEEARSVGVLIGKVYDSRLVDQSVAGVFPDEVQGSG